MSFPFRHNPLGRYLSNGRDFQLHEPVTYEIDNLRIVVPRWFITDWASVPRIFSWLIPKDRARRPAVIHDWLYSTRGMQGALTRRACDNIFLAAMRDSGVPWVTRGLIWLAVRVGGWYPWRQQSTKIPRIEPPTNDENFF
jgi:hypothetical protein